MKYDKRLLQNPLLLWTFLKNHRNVHPPSVDQNMEYHEAANYLTRHPEQMIPAAQLQKGGFSVNSGLYGFDTTARIHECAYCGKAFESKRSTAKYCCASHRALEFRRRRKAQLAEPNTPP
jgi:hypothetical protein